MGGIYIHIPYCRQKCSYCNFHFSTNVTDTGRMSDSLIKEVSLRSDELRLLDIETIYFGGGTPSIFAPEEMQRLIKEIGRIIALNKVKEVTIECNPDDLTLDYLHSLYNDSCINRLSVGIQSFFDDDLEMMNRTHSGRDSIDCLENIFKTGFDNVTADLIFGLPDNDSQKWERNLKKLIEFPVEHISCYGLTVEPKTQLEYDISRGKVPVPDEGIALDQFYFTEEYLTPRGFVHYEISNYAKPGKIAIHNTNYWRQEKYVGIGPSAHSFDGFRRRWNIANNASYMKKINNEEKFWEEEYLSEADTYNEWIMTGLRTIWGIDPKQIKKFTSSIQDEFFIAKENAVKKGRIAETEDRMFLTRRGKGIADSVISDFFFVR